MLKSTMAAIGAVAVMGASALAAPAPVDLSTWTEESISSGNWVLAPDNNSVRQTVNGQPTVYYDPENSQGKALSGTISVGSAGDDDFIGFVLGFEAGDLNNDNPGFLLLDWRRNSQSGVGPGMSLNRVVGNFTRTRPFSASQRATVLEELGRGSTLGDMSWEVGEGYNFELVFTATLVEVYVNDSLEISVNGLFDDGGFGFYNYSQANVTYGAIGEADAVVPVPGAAALFIPALLGGAAWKRRKKAA